VISSHETSESSASATDSAPRTRGLLGADLNLSYHHQQVVFDAHLQLLPGQVTALVGPNGSGKSTLLRSLARLHHPDSGELRFDDDSPALALSPKAFARSVTLLAQSRPTPTGVSVRDVVGYGRHPYRSRWRGADDAGPAAIQNAMNVTGVADMADRSVDELSGGEVQRVWFATCLAQATGVVLLDEPTTYLDLRYQVETLDLIRELADEHDVAVGLVLHDLNQAAAIANSVALLQRGHVRATGTPREVFASELLSETYGIRIDVVVNPTTGLVTTHPIGRHNEPSR